MRGHRLAVDDRGSTWRWRFRPSCSCGWLGIWRRSEAGAAALHVEHLAAVENERRPRRGSAPRPTTPPDALPDVLR